jgi:hypothetical protein
VRLIIFLHDFVDATINALGPCINERTSDGVFAHIALATVQLQAIAHHFALEVRSPVVRICADVCCGSETGNDPASLACDPAQLLAIYAASTSRFDGTKFLP